MKRISAISQSRRAFSLPRKPSLALTVETDRSDRTSKMVSAMVSLSALPFIKKDKHYLDINRLRADRHTDKVAEYLRWKTRYTSDYVSLFDD